MVINNSKIKCNKKVQMTRTQKGPNGEQQRVTFERDFKNENELNKFLKDFELNLNKSHQYGHQNYRPSSAASNHHGSAFGANDSSHHRTSSVNEELIKSPGFVSFLFNKLDNSLYSKYRV